MKKYSAAARNKQSTKRSFARSPATQQKKFQRFCTQSFVFFRARFLLAVLFYTNNHRRIQMRRRRFAGTVSGVNGFVVTKSSQNTTKTVHPNIFSYCLAQRTLPLHYNTFGASSYQPLRK